MTSERGNFYAFISFNIALLLFLGSNGPFLFADSQEYLSMSPLRAPVYPIFLYLLKLLSAKYFLHIAVFIQVGLTLFAARHLCGQLRRKLDWSLPVALFAYLLMLLPLFHFSDCALCLYIGNTIATEALAYPLFLLLCAAALRALWEPERKPLLLMAFLSAFGLLIRPQLIFTYPLTLFVIFISGRRKTWNATQLAPVLGAFLVFSGLAYLGQRTYNGFIRNPFLKQELLATVLYVSEPKDAELFASHRDSETVKKIFSRIESQNAFLAQKTNPTQPVSSHYTRNFDPICWGILHQSMAEDIGPEVTTPERFSRMDSVCGDMLRVLAPRKIPQLLKLLAIKLWTLGLFPLLAFAGYILSLLFTRDVSGEEKLFVQAVWVLAASNILLVAFSAELLQRYLFYTNMLMCVSLATILSHWQKGELRLQPYGFGASAKVLNFH